MKRRALLKGAAAVALGATAPAWIRSAFAGETCEGKAVAPKQGLIAVSQGYRAAQRAGKPLLVLVIPANPDERWFPGHAFGELFNHGTEEQLLPFAMVEVVCAKMDALRRIVPTAPPGEPLMVLVDTDRSPATARALNAKLSQDMDRLEGLKWDEYQKLEDKLIDTRIETLSKLVREAVAVEPALSRYAAQNRAALSSTEQQQLADDELSDSLVNRAGPVLTALAVSGKRNDLRPRLVASVAARVREKPPLGAKWALSGGCGVEIENPEPEEPNVAVACGMGHTPKRSRRFLYFYKRAYPRNGEDE